MTYDTIIIGQGLAGSLLAWRLLQRGQRIMVIDDGHRSSASRPAAGLVNPVTGQRLVKAPHVEQYLGAAKALYSSLEQHFSRQFFYPKRMLRLVRNSSEQQAWEKRLHDPAYTDFIGQRCGAHQHPTLQDREGSFYQLQTGYLDTNTLLDTLIDHLRTQQSYLCRAIAHDDIHMDQGQLRIGELRTRQVIFCEGYRAMQNPWFSWLPFNPAKGEILTLKSEIPLPDLIINAGKWLLPISDGVFKLGATYERETLDECPTDAGKSELMEAMQKIIKGPITTEQLAHHAGVRPCTRDRAPFIGPHPQYAQMSIFNGFGSKGSLMIPYYSGLLVDSLDSGKPIPAHADIRRYWPHGD